QNEIATLKVEYLKEQQDIAYNEIEKINKYISSIQKQMTNDLKKQLKKRVDDAYTIALNIYEENKAIKSELEIKHIIIAALSKIRFFDGRGYYFINTNQGKGVLFNGVSKIDTLPDLSDLKDSHGHYIIKEQIDIVQQKNQGYTTHLFHKIGETKTSRKLTFVRNFEPFDWHIGTGEYLDDFNNKIKDEIFRYVSNIRYGKNGYIFAMSSKGIILAHGDSPELIGKDMSKALDSNGVYYTKEVIKKAMLGSSEFVKYAWYNKQTQQIDIKYGYGRYFEKYDLVIGTGVFNNDVSVIIEKETKKLNKKNDEQIKQIMSISLVVLVIVLILSYMISNMVKLIFENYNNKLHNLNLSLAKRVEEEILISQKKR
ncbi:MAG: cache domain-containing protein, partial [Arcobacteraceae bacterium]